MRELVKYLLGIVIILTIIYTIFISYNVFVFINSDDSNLKIESYSKDIELVAEERALLEEMFNDANLQESSNDININYQARKIRNSKKYKSKGINVNFVAVDNAVSIRTYERGVEAETLSCGTGAVATAVGLHYSKNVEDNIIQLNTKGGVLTVSFDEFNGCYKNIWLTGEVNLVYIGEFEC